MSYSTNIAVLQRYAEKHTEDILKVYEPLLLNKKIVEFLGTEVGFHVSGSVKLEDETIYESHFRWSNERENDSCIENASADEDKEVLSPEDDEYCIPMEEYFNSSIVGKTITKIEIGASDRDDYLYVYAFVGNPDEHHYLEIPYSYIDDLNNENKDDDIDNEICHEGNKVIVSTDIIKAAHEIISVFKNEYEVSVNQCNVINDDITTAVYPSGSSTTYHHYGETVTKEDVISYASKELKIWKVVKKRVKINICITAKYSDTSKILATIEIEFDKGNVINYSCVNK